VNYAANIDFIHGLGTMVAMAPEGAKAIEGGNWQIFANMVKASSADVRLNSAVTGIVLNTDQKYEITTAPGSTKEAEAAQPHPVAFDDVIIATPFQFANISTDEDLIQYPIDKIPYATLHVTLLASSYKFSPAFFKMQPASNIPTSVLTTLGTDEEPQPGSSGAGKVGFYSATLQRIAMNPRTHSPEYVYKIFSPEAVTPGFLSELLGVEIPESFTSTDHDGLDGASDKTIVHPISWLHATKFHPYPQKYPRVTFQDPILRDGLYYTSGIESFISTMETSALMGMNVARLIIDEYAGIPRAEDQKHEAAPTMPQHGEEQNVLAQQQEKMVKDYGSPAEKIGEL
jgi:prenylcysteine oxidase/farnesylcysteine lyase